MWWGVVAVLLVVAAPGCHGNQEDCTRRCPPGYELYGDCEGCRECAEGTFKAVLDTLDYHATCEPCVVCPERFYERRPCMPMSDVMCDSCKEPGFGNEDFLKKCERTTTTTTTTTTPVPTTTTTTTTQAPTTADIEITVQDETTVKKIEPDDPDISTGVTSLTSSTVKVTEEGSRLLSSSVPVYDVTTEGDGSGDIDGSGAIDEEVQVTTEDLLDGGFIPVKRVTATQEVEVTTEAENVTDAFGFGIAGVHPNAGQSEELAKGGFQWQILVAAIVAGIVFLILGIVCSAFVRRRHKDPVKRPPPPTNGYADPEQAFLNQTYTTGLPSDLPLDQPVSDDDYDDEEEQIKPIYIVPEHAAPESADPLPPYSATPSPSPVIRRPKKNRRPNSSMEDDPLKRKTFGDSRDLRFIDEDSEDEIVHNGGRPPSVVYRDYRRKPKKKSSLGIMGRLKSKVGRNLPKMSRYSPVLKRSSSVSGPEDPKAPDYGTV